MNQPQQPKHNYVPQMASIVERINNKPRLVQCIQCHNEEEFIGLTLRSIYDEVDQIICVEGAVKNRPNSTPEGRSTDRTVEIIQDFRENHDPDNKLFFIQMKQPFENLEALKQTFLDLVNPGDWILINDADEFYRPEDIRRLRVAIDLVPHAQEFVPTFLHFYRDFGHVAVPGPEWQPQHQRVFKCVANMKYNSHPIADFENGESSYFSPYLQHRRYMLNGFFIYHYGYARQDMDEVMRGKQKYYEQELAVHGAANVKFDQKVTDWFDKTEPLLYFDGEHPEVILEHPNAKLLVTQNEASWRENEFYSKVLADEPYGNIWLCMTQQAHPFMNFYHNSVTVEETET